MRNEFLMEINPDLQYFLKMPAFREFSQVGQSSIYQEWPSGWSLVLTDIRGSTKALEQGRYKQVNMIGAASIAAFVKCAGTHEVPFVFGGDGATLLVPNSMLLALLEELKSLQNISLSQFSLELRVGYIDVENLKKLNQPLKVAKYELSPGNYLAQFAGGAVSLAETLIKSGDSKATILKSVAPHPSHEISGISCRLEPLKSARGKIVTLLCKPKNETDSIPVVNQVIAELNQILGRDLKAASPVKDEQLNWGLFPKTAGDEVRLMGAAKSPVQKISRWIGHILFAWVSNLSLRFEFNMGGFIPKKYKKELQNNSDFKKFDETLRMVVDCTESQIQQIQSLFEKLQSEGRIFFGLHISNEALMTCMVQSPTQNRHIHFIDGADGGYAMAAVQMKKQMQSSLLS